MTIDEVVQLTRARLQKDLHPVQEIILRQVWEGKTYTSIASTSQLRRALPEKHRLRLVAISLSNLAETYEQIKFSFLSRIAFPNC